MSTRSASFSSLLVLFFFLAAPTSLAAQVRPETGYAGRAGAEGKNRSPARLLQMQRCDKRKKLVGYGCTGTPNPQTHHQISLNISLYDSNKISRISLKETFIENGPTVETMREALFKKYGQPSGEYATGIRWQFDRKGNVLTNTRALYKLDIFDI